MKHFKITAYNNRKQRNGAALQNNIIKEEMTDFEKQLLERLEDLSEQLEGMRPDHMDTMTGMSLIDVELMKADMMRQIIEALKGKK